MLLHNSDLSEWHDHTSGLLHQFFLNYKVQLLIIKIIILPLLQYITALIGLI